MRIEQTFYKPAGHITGREAEHLLAFDRQHARGDRIDFAGADHIATATFTELVTMEGANRWEAIRPGVPTGELRQELLHFDRNVERVEGKTVWYVDLTRRLREIAPPVCLDELSTYWHCCHHDYGPRRRH